MAESEVLPPPVTVVNGNGRSPYVLLCEHASRFIPARFHGLGLDDSDLQRHIAWDIGAAHVANSLSSLLDAPLILAGYSRLLIDLNRPVDSPSSIPAVSELTDIPGNQDLGAAARNERIASYFMPFHAAVEAVLDRRQAAAHGSTVIGVHSFTPVYKGVTRPWKAGVLFRRSERFGKALARALGGTAAGIAENEPYQIEDDSDYTVPVHGEARGLDAVLIELRQDLIAGPQDGEIWARRLAEALQAISTTTAGVAT